MRTFDLSIDYSQQRDWSSAIMCTEMAFGTVAAGMFVFSIMTGFSLGALIAFVSLLVVKGLLLMVDLGKPGRFLKVFKKLGNSWISKGAWGMLLFGVIGACYFAALYLCPELTVLVRALGIASCLLAVFMAVYDSFTMIDSRGVALWGDSGLPVLFGASAAASGSGALMALSALFPDVQLEPLCSWNGVAVLVLALALFSVLRCAKKARGGRMESAQLLSKGSLAAAFKLGAVGLGIVVPLAVCLVPALGFSLPALAWAVVGACEVIGAFALRFTFMKAGSYSPVM
ncbi:MAG: NrfD/PsrC family molybdoenzyme membrane anchor subunit [Coriobacteriales bacterium]